MNMLSNLWARLTDAPSTVTDPERCRQIRLLSGLLVVLIPLGLLSIGVQLVLVPGFVLTFAVVALAFLLLGAAYGCARRGWYTAGALLTVTVLGCFGAILLNPHDVFAYAYLGISLILAAMLFSARGMLLTAAANLLGVTLLLPMGGVTPPHGDLVAMPMFLVITTALLLLGMRHRDALERDRQAGRAAHEENFRVLAGNIRDGILVNAGGRHVFANSAMAEMLGYAEAGELLGTTVEQVVHPRALPLVRDRIHRRLAGEPVPRQYETVFVSKAGEPVPVEIHASLTVWQGQPAGLISVRDVRERQRAEQALRTSEARLNEAQHIAHVGSWELDLACNRLTWSDEIFRIFEIDSARFGASYEAFLDTVHPDDREAVNRAYTESVRNRTPYQIVHRLLMPDGSIKYVHERGETHYDAQGNPLRSLGTVQDVTERVRAEETAGRFGRMLDSSSNEIYIFDAATFRFAQVNEGARRNLGYSMEELAELTPLDLKPEYSREMFEAQIAPLKRGETDMQVFETVHRRKDGTLYPVEVRLQLSRGETPPVFVAVILDITERKRVEAQMRKLSGALAQSADGVMITDRQGVIEYVNLAFEGTTGYAREEVLGRTPRLLKSGRQGAAFYQQLWMTILAGETFRDVFINRRKDGSLYYEEKTITPLKDEAGRVTHFISTGKDVTERMHAQERLQHMAQHDALTDLPNRALFLDRLKQAMARARWHQRLVAVLFVDMDRFKTINDTLGHEAGDRLLQQLAERFSRNMREGDTVARFGGDEFVILLDDVSSEIDVGGVAQKVQEALAGPFEIDGQKLYITASIGVSLFPNDGEDSTTLLKNADIAMYRAKEAGKNTCQFYSADMSARAFERLTLESSLRNALERGEFRVYYQPQVDVDSGAIIGMEALLRWQHPDFGLVLPSDFIPLLEETGLIVPAGEWVLRTACEQLAAWHAAGWRGLHMAVNLSPRQFQSPGLLAAVKHALGAFEREAGHLELEITESVLARHVPATLETLETLRALGVRLAIDDFGTGYSSLAYLRRFPIDTLKVDRSFVRDIPGDADDSAITVAVLALAQSLKLEAIAEGVENTEQRDFLRARGCRFMQGYLFSKPLPAEEMTRLLRAQPAG